MTTLLTRLRQNAPRVTTRQFLSAHPGSWIQYYDDTPAKNPAKALSARSFDPALARRKQCEGCAIAFSLQPFGESRTKDQLLCFRTLGVDVDLIAPPVRASVPDTSIDERKERYLRAILAPFSLRPHWLVETRHGFHLLFRVQPQRKPETIAEARALNLRLVEVLKGDRNAVLLTQLMRVPGTLQFKVPDSPFLCRLLLDNAATIPPYPLAVVCDALGQVALMPAGTERVSVRRWRQGLAGAAEGERNVTAASLVGRVLRSLPSDLWETAGWGGLKEWNSRNSVPLPERELRAVYESIARMERANRMKQTPPASSPLERPTGPSPSSA